MGGGGGSLRKEVVIVRFEGYVVDGEGRVKGRVRWVAVRE